jgi:parallel beta-helix repeat protein
MKDRSLGKAALVLALITSARCGSSAENVLGATDAVSKPVTIDFDHPQPPGKSGDLLAQFLAIDFGSHWRWRSGVGGDATNSIEFASSNASSESFTFIHGERYLQSLKAFTHDGSKGRLTVSDDRGQRLDAAVDGTLRLVSTGWSKPSTTITVAYTAGVGVTSSLGVDDLTYVLPLRIVTQSLPGGVVRRAYSAQLVASGGTSPLSWSIAHGALPAGLSLDPASGLISGTPTTAGTVDFVVQVSDANQSASQPLSTAIEDILQIKSTRLNDGMQGVVYTPDVLVAGGGSGQLTWSASGLPEGLALSGDTIAGTVTPGKLPVGGQAFTYTVSITVQDALQQASAQLGLTVSPADFFIAASPIGSDSNNGLYAQASGGANGPFASINGAQSALSGLVGGRSTPIYVYLRGGTYFLTSTIQPTTSGTEQAPILYQAFPQDPAPVLSGGVQIEGPWTATSKQGGTVWSATLPTSFVDFGALFIDGVRHYTPRARTSNSTGYLYNAGPVCLSSSDPTFDASACTSTTTYCGGTKPYECFDRFYFNPGDISPNWSNIEVNGSHPILVDDFECWEVSKLRLKSVNVQRNIAYLTGPTRVNYRCHGFMPEHRYLVENVEDYLTDKNGNFYVDESTTPWTLSYFTTAGDDPNKEAVIAPQLAPVLKASSLEHVTFRGLTFSHDDWVPPPQGYVSTQAETSVPAAISFVDSSFVTLDGCIVSQTSGHGLEITADTGGTGNNQVINSGFWDIGAGGMRIGLPLLVHPQNSLQTASNLISNNIITGVGRVAAGGALLFVGDSNDNTIQYNELYDGYGDGISMGIPGNDGTEYGNLIQFNHVHDIKQGVTSDGGGIYVFSANTTAFPNIVRNNWVHDVTGDPGPHGYGGEGIYLDANNQNAVVENNIAYRTSGPTMFLNYAYNNVIKNNIFAYGRDGVIGRGTAYNYGPLTVPAFVATSNIFYWDRNTTFTATSAEARGWWGCFEGNGYACTSQFLFQSNIYWDSSDRGPQFLVDEHNTWPNPPRYPHPPTPISFAAWQALGEDRSPSAIIDPLFTDPTCPTDDFSLQPSSPVGTIGFVPFDYHQAGRNNPVLIAPALDAAYPLQLPANKCAFY